MDDLEPVIDEPGDPDDEAGDAVPAEEGLGSEGPEEEGEEEDAE